MTVALRAPDRAGGLARNLVLTSISNALSPATSLITFPILAHVLGVGGRGAVATATAPVLFAAVMSGIGLPEALIYFLATKPAAALSTARRAGAAAILSGTLAVSVIIISARELSGGNTRLSQYIVYASIAVVPILLVSIARAAAVGIQAFGLVRWEQVISAAFSLAAIVSLALSKELTVTSAIAATCVTAIIGGTAYLGLGTALRHRSVSVGSSGIVSVSNRKLASYAAKSWAGSLSGMAVSRLDQSLMTALSSSYQLGLYAVAVNVSELPLIIASAVSLLTLSSYAADRSEARLTMAARLSSTLSFAIAIITCSLSPLLFPYVLGRDFSKAIPSTVVLTFAVVLGTPGSVAASGLSARGRPDLRSMGLILAAFFNVGLLFVLLPSYGEFGAALAMLATNLFTNSWSLAQIYRVAGIRPREFYGIRAVDVHVLAGQLRSRLGYGSTGEFDTHITKAE